MIKQDKMKKRFVLLFLVIFYLAACSIQNDTVLNKTNNRATLHAEMAIAYLAKNDLPIAILESDQALKLNNEDVYVKYVAGLVSAAAGQTQKAQKIFEDILWQFNQAPDELFTQSLIQPRTFNHYWLNYAKILCHLKNEKQKENFLMVIQRYLSNFENEKSVLNKYITKENSYSSNQAYTVNEINNSENLIKILKKSQAMLQKCT